jgi:lauroyl/myristoyl acyltransferase
MERALIAIEALRRRVPGPLLPVMVQLRFLLSWARSEVRADARAQMAFLLEESRPDADIEAAARAYVRRQVWRGELRWHPELITHKHIEGLDHLVNAQELGRGVMLNFMHHGTYEGAFASLNRLGLDLQMIVYPYMMRDDAPRWLKQHMRVACIGGGRPVSAEVGTQGILDLLNQGNVVAVASDVPGRTPLRFAGRDVLGSYGAARLAADAGSPVIVMTLEKGERGSFVRLHEALDPKEFETPRQLLDEMLARHEKVILGAPEATDLPLSRWGVPQPDSGASHD